MATPPPWYRATKTFPCTSTRSEFRRDGSTPARGQNVAKPNEIARWPQGSVCLDREGQYFAGWRFGDVERGPIGRYADAIGKTNPACHLVHDLIAGQIEDLAWTARGPGVRNVDTALLVGDQIVRCHEGLSMIVSAYRRQCRSGWGNPDDQAAIETGDQQSVGDRDQAIGATSVLMPDGFRLTAHEAQDARARVVNEVKVIPDEDGPLGETQIGRDNLCTGIACIGAAQAPRRQCRRDEEEPDCRVTSKCLSHGLRPVARNC